MRFGLVGLAIVLVLACTGAPAFGQTPATPDVEALRSEATAVAPVIVDGEPLFSVRGVSAFPAETRAAGIRGRIEAAAANRQLPSASLTLEERPEGTAILASGRVLVFILDEDAALEQLDRALLAQTYLQRIQTAIDAWRRDREPRRLLVNAALAVGATALVLAVLVFGRRLLRRLHAAIENRYLRRLSDVQIQQFQVVPASQIWRVVGGGVNLAGVLALLAFALAYLEYVLVLFPWTRGVGHSLIGMMVTPLRTLGSGFAAQVPNLAFLLVLFLLVRYVLKTIKLFFEAIGNGSVKLPDFEPEWALPTYRLVRMVFVALALVVAYPYIPGSGSAAFQGLTVFLGILFSLGSSSVIANIIAGYTITYRRAFRTGDRVKIGNNMGAVERVRLMVTHLRTAKNEEVIVPNSTILGTEVVNYSSLAASHGLILHTTVGIGYETPWRQVEAMLLESAARTPGLLEKPAPFVLQRALGDFAVTYEINVYCATADRMLATYADLHRSILDVFNEYGVQIMTPAYEGDPEQPKLVPKTDWYTAPAREPGDVEGAGESRAGRASEENRDGVHEPDRRHGEPRLVR